MSERITLDPSEVSTPARTEVDITEWIDPEGADWGEATIEPFMADKDRGSVPVDFRVPNREITIPLKLTQTIGGTTTVQARAAIQAKAALFQKEGGWLKRITNSGGTVYADVVDASFAAASVAGFESRQEIDLDAHLTLTCLPDFYEAEQTLGDHVESSNPELVFTETNVSGDYPARMRMVVDDDQGQDQRGLLWGFRSRYYDSSATAALRYSAEALQPLDTASKVALSGASGGTVVKHGTLSTNWTPVLGTNKGGTAYLTHKGTYRLYARVYSASGTLVQARAVWDVGDLVNPVENDAWRLPGASNFYLHDFGEIRLDPSPVGTHRWQGQIQAKGDAGGENFSVDKLWLQPVDEGAGVLTAPISSSLSGFTTYSARDEFKQTAGTLTTKIAPIGGTWTGGGDTHDFLVETSGLTAQRTAVSDTGPRADWPTSMAALTTTQARVDFKSSVINNTNVFMGLALRIADASNYFQTYVEASNTPSFIWAKKYVAASATAIQSAQLPNLQTSTWYTIMTFVDTGGRFAVWFGPKGSNLQLYLASGDSSLATGGALASGKAGIYDYAWDAAGKTRNYDNFGAWVPDVDAVTFASQSTQLTTDGHYRLDTGGTAYGPVAIQSGDLPRLPVAGLEGRTTEVFLKASRGDFDQLPDSGIDDLSARVYYNPSWLVVPDT